MSQVLRFESYLIDLAIAVARDHGIEIPQSHSRPIKLCLNTLKFNQDFTLPRTTTSRGRLACQLREMSNTEAHPQSRE